MLDSFYFLNDARRIFPQKSLHVVGKIQFQFYIVNHKGVNMKSRQSLLPCITHNGYYLKVCILRLVNAIQKVCSLLPTLYKYRGEDEIKRYNIAKNDCLAFKTNIFCVSKPTLYSLPQNHIASQDEAFSTQRCIAVFQP